MNCIWCNGKIEFDHHGSIEIQFHAPDMSIEHYVVCSVRCARRWFTCAKEVGEE